MDILVKTPNSFETNFKGEYLISLSDRQAKMHEDRQKPRCFVTDKNSFQKLKSNKSNKKFWEK